MLLNYFVAYYNKSDGNKITESNFRPKTIDWLSGAEKVDDVQSTFSKTDDTTISGLDILNPLK